MFRVRRGSSRAEHDGASGRCSCRPSRTSCRVAMNGAATRMAASAAWTTSHCGCLFQVLPWWAGRA